jgi:hypothetical protein
MTNAFIDNAIFYMAFKLFGLQSNLYKGFSLRIILFKLQIKKIIYYLSIFKFILSNAFAFIKYQKYR